MGHMTWNRDFVTKKHHETKHKQYHKMRGKDYTKCVDLLSNISTRDLVLKGRPKTITKQHNSFSSIRKFYPLKTLTPWLPFPK